MPSSAMRFLAAALCLPALGSPAQHPAPTVHIAVMARQLSGEAINDLREAQFRVTEAGLPLRVQLTPAPAATCLLILNTASTGFRTSTQQQELLARVVGLLNRASYRIAALGAQGEYAGFEPAKTALLNAFQPDRLPHRDILYAMSALGSCQGRRAVLYLTDPKGRAPFNLVTAADRIGALVYQVGGDPRQNYDLSNGDAGSTAPYREGERGGPLSPASAYAPTAPVAQSWESYPERTVHTVDVEATLPGAIAHMQRNLAGFYDLFVSLPPAGAAQLHLSVKTRTSAQLSAFSYGYFGASPAPDLVLDANPPAR